MMNVVFTLSVPKISEIVSIEKVIIQVCSRPFSLYGKRSDITGISKYGEAFNAIVSPPAERRTASSCTFRKVSITPVSISFEIKNRLFSIRTSVLLRLEMLSAERIKIEAMS